MDDRMQCCLERAVQERAVKVNGKEMNPHWLKTVMDASLAEGAKGFGANTLWRALEIATELAPSEPPETKADPNAAREAASREEGSK